MPALTPRSSPSAEVPIDQKALAVFRPQPDRDTLQRFALVCVALGDAREHWHDAAVHTRRAASLVAVGLGVVS